MGVNYDLFVYATCGGAPIAASTNAAGMNETIIVKTVDDCANGDNGFDYWVEIRHVSGSSCASWTVSLDGTNC